MQMSGPASLHGVQWPVTMSHTVSPGHSPWLSPHGRHPTPGSHIIRSISQMAQGSSNEVVAPPGPAVVESATGPVPPVPPVLSVEVGASPVPWAMAASSGVHDVTVVTKETSTRAAERFDGKQWARPATLRLVLESRSSCASFDAIMSNLISKPCRMASQAHLLAKSSAEILRTNRNALLTQTGHGTKSLAWETLIQDLERLTRETHHHYNEGELARITG